MPGIEKPYTSASRTATSWPVRASTTARLTVTDDLPTPPLPELIPMTRVRLCGPKGFGRPCLVPEGLAGPVAADAAPAVARRWRRAHAVGIVGMAPGAGEQAAAQGFELLRASSPSARP